MVSKGFCLLLLFSVLWYDVAANPYRCRSKNNSREIRCATRDVMWGWLNVVNQPVLRAEGVIKNVSKIKQQAHEMRSKAEVAIVEYRKLLASLNSTGSENEIKVINQAIADVSDGIAQTNNSELKAKNATNEAEESLASSARCFDAIMRVACYLWGVDPDGKWNNTSVKATLEQYDEGCEEKYNISKTLSSNIGHIDFMDLTEWKSKTLDALQKAYEKVESRKSHYHTILTKGDKIKEVKDAVSGAMGRLEVAVKNFELYRAAVETAIAKINNASCMVKEANSSLLASENGKTFCEVVDRFSKSKKRLKTVDKTVTGAKQNAADVLSRSKRMYADVKTADELMSDVVAWFQRGDLTLFHKWSGTHNLENTARNATAARGAASTSARAASEASSAACAIEKEAKTQLDSLKHVEEQLANMNVVVGTDISDVTFDVCNYKLSEILEKGPPGLTRSIAKFNKALLAELNAALLKIDGKAIVIENALPDARNKAREAESSAHNAFLFSNQATKNAKETIVKVLENVVASLCAVLSELQALHDEAGAFSVHAAHAQANISEWLVGVDATAKESDGFADSSGSVEGAFATAGKRLEVLRRVLHRADEQRDKVVRELAEYMAVLENSNGASELNKTLRDVLANVASMEAKTFSKDACNASLMTQSLKLLSNMTDHTAVMNSLQVVAQLNRLTESMKERVLKAHNLMRMAAESSAQADAALEEAIRMARERSGKPQCPALYRQLLGALGLHW
ncbi:hypothetical protein ERJ75_000482500 [Trypanosoma vivax]|nr:hypothetical protein ERJ75_000482500 [Trypanosoma vivax]